MFVGEPPSEEAWHGFLTRPFASPAAEEQAPAPAGETARPPRANSFVSGNGALTEIWGRGFGGVAGQQWAGLCCSQTSSWLLQPALESPLTLSKWLKRALSNSGLLEAALHNSEQLPGSPPCPPGLGWVCAVLGCRGCLVPAPAEAGQHPGSLLATQGFTMLAKVSSHSPNPVVSVAGGRRRRRQTRQARACCRSWWLCGW